MPEEDYIELMVKLIHETGMTKGVLLLNEKDYESVGPKIVKQVNGRPEAYNKQAEELQKMEKSKQIFCIAPKEPVKVGRLEHNVKKLKDLYEKGYADAKESFDEMIEYLEQDQKSSE